MDRTMVSHFNFKTDIYFEDLQKVLDKVERNNGKVIVSKTPVNPAVGYVGIFILITSRSHSLVPSQPVMPPETRT